MPLALHLVMSDHDLFGTGDEPAFLDGFGPVPAELARELVVGACSRRERLWLRRLYAHPVTGELVAAETRGRYFRASLARFIRLRDRTCRTPWCHTPVRHGDHALDPRWAVRPTPQNGQGLCEACDYAKQAPGWRARRSPGSKAQRSRRRCRRATVPLRPPPTVATPADTDPARLPARRLALAHPRAAAAYVRSSDQPALPTRATTHAATSTVQPGGGSRRGGNPLAEAGRRR